MTAKERIARAIYEADPERDYVWDGRSKDEIVAKPWEKVSKSGRAIALAQAQAVIDMALAPAKASPDFNEARNALTALYYHVGETDDGALAALDIVDRYVLESVPPKNLKGRKHAKA